MVASLAQRMTEGAGSPAEERSATGTSSLQERFSALVIIKTHSRLCSAAMSPAAMTSAGLRCRTGLSAYGNGTLTTSHGSKLGIGLAIVVGGPLAECGEGIVGRCGTCLRQNDSITLDRVGDLVAGIHPQRGPDRLRDR